MVYSIHETLKASAKNLMERLLIGKRQQGICLALTATQTQAFTWKEGASFHQMNLNYFHFLLLANCCSKARVSWQLMPILLVEGKKCPPNLPNSHLHTNISALIGYWQKCEDVNFISRLLQMNKLQICLPRSAWEKVSCRLETVNNYYDYLQH